MHRVYVIVCAQVTTVTVTAFVTFTPYTFDGVHRTSTWQSLDLVLPPLRLLFSINKGSLYAPSHRHDSTSHGLYYTSCGALARTIYERDTRIFYYS